MRIVDGRGQKYHAKVNSEFKLETAAVGKQIAAWKTILGRTYLVSTGLLDITTTEGMVAWFYYGAAVGRLAIAEMSVNWNGGNTNHDRAAEVRFVVGDTQPDTNVTVGTPRNCNTGSTRTLTDSVFLYWDGVSTGMTGFTPGVTFSEVISRPGRNVINVAGKLVVSPGMTMSVHAKGEEAGRLSFSAWFFEYDDSELEV